MFLIKVLCTFSQLVVTDKKRKQRNLLPNFIVLIICSIYFPMGIKLNRPIIVQILFLVFIVLSLFRITTSDNLRPANFVFGDSLVDVGNNNYIASLSRANYVPFGIDFGRPTGRFTNGRTIVDIIGQEMGIDFTPPYLAPTTAGPVILNGVNYASGAGGILNLTGKLFGDRINFDAQLDNFANTRQDIISYIGLPATLNLFRRSIFSVTMGSNDFINNYLAPAVIILEQELASPELFVTTLVSRFREQLIRLFNMGARKITVTNVGPIGCIPSQRDTNPAAGDDCVTFPNQLAQLFNFRLKGLIQELNSNLKGSMFVYADVYHILEDLLNNYAAYGFEDPSSGCCRVLLGGRFGGLIPCGPTSTVCSDRSKYVFWDPWHPTDAANVIIAKRLLDGDHNDIFPVNVRKLIQY
ncbi:GDSL esterase/lipase At4g16230-like isoform X1 [Cajanus cajan]|uniref:GDSL esterase/lipase At4g16230-like isoform X1 n=1 Tax=Cajanus cajan TaxID=3821 RepID=UPI0010FB4722|nr:GDSL esterase/lipase At4g16230-like isoform X1 [Cajanus cajan]